MGKVFRKRSAQSVIAEIEELRFKHGFKEFEIIDDCFNLDRERMHAILTGIRDRIGDAKLHFPNGVRADMLEPQDLNLFKQAGTVSAGFAIETSSPRIQKMIKRNLNIDKAVKAINASVQAGIYSIGFFMLGFPTETYEEAYDTVEFAANSSLHRALFFHPMPFAGTEIARLAADANQAISPFDPAKMKYGNSTFNISAMSDDELKTIYSRAYRNFYLNFKRMFRVIIYHPRIFSLPHYAFLVLLRALPKKS